MGFDEVTASSLVKLTIDGEIVGGNEKPVFKPGFVIHSAVHGARKCETRFLHFENSVMSCSYNSPLIPF